VQLAFARQGAKEQGESDDAGRRSDDSYSPRGRWYSMFKPEGEAWVRGLRVMTFVSSDDDLDWEFAFDYTRHNGTENTNLL